MGCVVWGFVAGVVVYLGSHCAFTALAAVAVGGFGLPNWVLRFKAKRRTAKFVNEFPNAVDIIVRGIRAGLPLSDCMRVIVTETTEPVRSKSTTAARCIWAR